MELDERVTRVEAKQEQQGKEIENLSQKTNQLHGDLSDLKSVLVMIKYWLYGIGTFYMVSEIGLAVTLKKYFGI